MKYAPIKKDEKRKVDRKTKVKISNFATYLIFLIVGVAMAAYIVADWSAEHQLVKQKMLSVTVQMPFRVEDIPDEIISPLGVEAKEKEEDTEFSDLSEIEQKIFDTFGARDFAVMRAIATCESRTWKDGELIPYNPEAVNWRTKDVGLFQIHWERVGNEDFEGWGKAVEEEFGYTLSDMFDVDKNIEVAKWIWDRNGDGRGNINPWVSVNTQCFKDEL